MMKRILVTGACGQIGSELTPVLRERHGPDNVIATDIRPPEGDCAMAQGAFELLDVCDRSTMEHIVDKHKVDTIYHMAAILSANGEANPQLAWNVNMSGLVNVLEIARSRDIPRIFSPSSIAVFGPETPRENTPQATLLGPTTIYGLTKVTGEMLAEYYIQRYGMDIRGVRYPGIISSVTPPGGGTTDYAVEIFYEALKHKAYTCFVGPDTVLPMMYMPDCIKATLDLMDADAERLTRHADFNIASMSFSAQELAQEIRNHIPEFEVTYAPDHRQEIANSWPQTIDDSAARTQWNWCPDYDLEAMTADMLEKLSERLLK